MKKLALILLLSLAAMLPAQAQSTLQETIERSQREFNMNQSNGQTDMQETIDHGQREFNKPSKPSTPAKPEPVIVNPRQLEKAYVYYIIVKKCFDAREGYLAAYISEPEMHRAKQETSDIEKKLGSGSDTKHLWESANITVMSLTAIIIGLPSGNMSATSQNSMDRWCQGQLMSLDSLYHQLAPESNFTHKDF
jgi:hypothetical protein